MMETVKLIELVCILIGCILLLLIWYYTRGDYKAPDSLILKMYETLGYITDKLTVDVVNGRFITLTDVSNDHETPSFKYTTTDVPYNLNGPVNLNTVTGNIVSIQPNEMLVSGIVDPLVCGDQHEFNSNGDCVPKQICQPGDYIKNIDYNMFHQIQNQKTRDTLTPIHPKLFVECHNDQTYTVHECPDNKITSRNNQDLDSACIYDDPCPNMVNFTRHILLPVNNNEYYVCENGTSIKHSCDTNQYLEPNLILCVDEDPCKNLPDGYFLKLLDSNRFVQCNSGESKTITCTYGVDVGVGCSSQPPPPIEEELIYYENSNVRYPIGTKSTQCPGSIVNVTVKNKKPDDYNINSPDNLISVPFNTAYWDGTQCTTRTEWNIMDLQDLPIITLSDLFPTQTGDPITNTLLPSAVINDMKYTGLGMESNSNYLPSFVTSVKLASSVLNSPNTLPATTNDGFRFGLHNPDNGNGVGAIIWANSTTGTNSSVTGVGILTHNRILLLGLPVTTSLVNSLGVLWPVKTNVITTTYSGSYGTPFEFESATSVKLLNAVKPMYTVLSNCSCVIISEQAYDGKSNTVTTAITQFSTQLNTATIQFSKTLKELLTPDELADLLGFTE